MTVNSESWIGDENNETPGYCAFAVKPGQPKCGAPATVHILSESAIYGPVGLLTCEGHALVARAAGPLLAEHPVGEACKAHSAWWRPDGCVSAPADSSGAA